MPILRTNGFRRSLLPRLPEYLNAPTPRVYALTDGAAIKVGKSQWHPHDRLKTLATGNPRPLVLLAYTLTISESSAHRLFAPHHLYGEWFVPGKSLLEAISRWDWVDETALLALREAPRTFTTTPLTLFSQGD